MAEKAEAAYPTDDARAAPSAPIFGISVKLKMMSEMKASTEAFRAMEGWPLPEK